jgi:2,4-dienoyl-CoA reductase-like NADH-dependent reductase (Old Yellow Enzyme family)
MSKVFSNKMIRNTVISNRVVLPPLVTFHFSENGYVNHRKLNHYQAIAKNGVGMIVVEATAIDPNGRLSDDQLGIWSDDFIPGLTILANTIHQEGVKAVIQVHHAGAKTRVTGFNDLVSASQYRQAREMRLDEIKQTIRNFRDAAIRAYKCGFDGVEIHGAHGYLLTQFFSEKSNHRNDLYGGSFNNRIRIAEEIIQAIRTSVDDEDFFVGIRMGCNENSLDESKRFARSFESFGYDYLSVSSGLDGTPIEKPNDFPFHWIVYGGTQIKKVVSIPVIGVYGIKTEKQVKTLIESNLLDFVAVGRGQLADYNFTSKLKSGEKILYCLDCNPCQWRIDGENCPRQKQFRQKTQN